jgi:glucokinase
MKNFIVITLGTGVGSGIVIDGKLLYGHDGFAGELGHCKIDHSGNGRLCGCGQKGCIEAYASATGVARTAKEIVTSTTQPTLLQYVQPLRCPKTDTRRKRSMPPAKPSSG